MRLKMRIHLVLALVFFILEAVAGQRCSFPEDLEEFMRAIDGSGQCLQDYRDFMNLNNEMTGRSEAANRWCSQCAESVQHWYEDVCVEIAESQKIGHFCASNGQTLCYFVAEGIAFDVNNLAITCGLEFENGTSTGSVPVNCTNECRNALQQAASSAGCCFESAFNVSETSEIERGLASYELWDSCGLDTSTVDYCPERLGTRNCTDADLFQFLQNLGGDCVSDFVIQLQASPENFDVRVEAAARWCENCAPKVYTWFLECGDDINADEIAHVCGHDGTRNCFHYTRESRFYQTEAETCGIVSEGTYLPFPSTCPEGCADALSDISKNLGCCFESAFNATDTLTIRLGLANNDLWRVCGLDPESVEACPNPFTDGAWPLNASLFVCIIAALISIVSF